MLLRSLRPFSVSVSFRRVPVPWYRSRLVGHLSKNRYKHILVRFSPAIHGLRHFWKGAPQAGTRTLGLQQIESLVAGNPGHCMRRDWVERRFKTVEGHGRALTSPHGRTRRRVLKSPSPQFGLAPNLFGDPAPPTGRPVRVEFKPAANSRLAKTWSITKRNSIDEKDELRLCQAEE